MRTTSQGVRKAILADHGARVCALMAAALLPLLLSACATEEPKRVLRYDIQEERDPDRLVWPPSPEVPRFVYLGELRGKQNLEVVEEDKNQGLGKVFGWILGLGQESRHPTPCTCPQPG